MKCAWKGCEAEASLTPIISFTALGHPNDEPVEGHIGMVVCPEHASTDPSMVISDSGWEAIERMLASKGLARPDRKSLKIRYEQMN